MTATENEDATWAQPLRRMLDFAGGFFVGLVVLPLGGALALTLLILVWPKPTGSTAHFSLSSSGSDISRAGGRVLEVRRVGEALRQVCRDACDDIRLETHDRTVESVRVLDARGGCVACRDVTGPYQPEARARRWKISGAPQLAIVSNGHE
jgi:hypothetical protein